MRRRVLAAVGIGVLALSGCSVGADSMQAAASDEFTISQAQVETQVGEVLTGLEQPPGEPPAGLALAVTQRLVQDALSEAKAAEVGVAVTQAEIEQGISELAANNGGQAALEQAALQAGIPKSALGATIRTQLLLAKIGQQLAAGGDQTAQQAAATAELSAFSEAIDVRVSPRYGTWDDASLSITPGSTVSSPAPAAS